MAILAGNAGKVVIDAATVAEIDNWTLTLGKNTAPTAAFGDTWEENTATLGRWSGSFSGRYDNTDTDGQVAIQTAVLAGTALSLKFYVDTTHYYSGTALVEMNPTAAESGLVDCTFNFTGSGALSYT